MKCSRCKLLFPKDEIGGDIIGLSIAIEGSVARGGKKLCVEICFECWIESLGVNIEDCIVTPKKNGKPLHTNNKKAN